MKKIIKSLCIILALTLIAFVAVISVSATETSGTTGDCTWTFDDDTGVLKITGSGAMGDYSHYSQDAPEYAVYADSITKVVIGDSVTRIGDDAFYKFKNLSSAKIGNKVSSIGMFAFTETALTSVNIPGNVKEILDSAFYSCKKLKKVTLNGGLKTIEYQAFCNCTNLEEFRMPNTVTYLGSCICKGCTSLTKVIISENVSEVSASDFEGCKNLTYIKLQPKIKTVDEHAFANCTSMKKVFIPQTVKKIDSHAFGYKYKMAAGEQVYSKLKNYTVYTIKNSVGDKYAKSKKFTVKYVALSAYTASMKVKGTKTLKASGGKVSKWVTSNAKIAKVNQNGKITALKKGTAYIYAKMTNGCTPFCKVTVK